MTLSQTRKQGSDIKFINEEGDIYLTNVYTETINGVLVKDNLYIYVDATLGSDTTGDGTSALPFKTIQKGFDKMVEYVSPNIKWLIIRDGTYNENIEVPQTLVGSIYLVGDTADASNVVVQASNVNSPVFRVNCTGTIYFNGLTIQGATASHGILCENSQCFILYSNFFNNRTGVFSYNSGNVYFAGPGLPYPDSVIDGNNISGSYGLKSEFDSVISSSQDLTIQNVDYGISCKYSSASLMGTYNITAKYSAILAKDNSYLAFGLGTYNLTGSSNALTTVRGVVVEESQIDLSQVTINFDTFYYGFYGLTGCKIAEAESITQHYNYTDVTKPAYIEYDSVISSTTDLDTTIEYFESAVAFGLDEKYIKADDSEFILKNNGVTPVYPYDYIIAKYEQNDKTYYVDYVNGTDAEGYGEATGADAFKTLGYALSYIPQNPLVNYNIYLADSLSYSLVSYQIMNFNCKTLSIYGNVSDRELVRITPAGSSLEIKNSKVDFYYLTFRSDGNDFNITNNSFITFTECRFGVSGDVAIGTAITVKDSTITLDDVFFTTSSTVMDAYYSKIYLKNIKTKSPNLTTAIKGYGYELHSLDGSDLSGNSGYNNFPLSQNNIYTIGNTDIRTRSEFFDDFIHEIDTKWDLQLLNADADIDNKLNGILDITFAPDDPEEDPPAVSGEAMLSFGSDIYTQYFNWTTSFEIAFKIVGETPQSNASVGMYLRYNTSAPSPYIAMYANAVSGTGLTCKGYNQPAIGVTVVGPSIELNKSVIMTCIPSYSDGISFNKKLSFFVNGILIGEITNQDNIPDTDELLALSILIRVNALNAIELDYVKLWTPRPPNAP